MGQAASISTQSVIGPMRRPNLITNTSSSTTTNNGGGTGESSTTNEGEGSSTSTTNTSNGHAYHTGTNAYSGGSSSASTASNSLQCGITSANRHTNSTSTSGLPFSSAASLADTASNQLRENLESLHEQLMQHAGADYDLATATTLTYSKFLSYITQLNQICRLYQDDDGHVLVFAVKKGTDSSIFWKATVRVACVKYHIRTNTSEAHRLLTIRQFLQVFRRISYECTDGSLGAPPSPTAAAAAAATTSTNDAAAQTPLPPTLAASVVLGELRTREASQRTEGAEGGLGRSTSPSSELEECVICLERKPDVILPCAHAYCLPCIQQWWEYCKEGTAGGGGLQHWDCNTTLFNMMPINNSTELERTCPVCRECVTDTDDTWVISEAPDDALVTHEISQALMGLADGGSGSGDWGAAGSGSCEGGARHCGGYLVRRPN